MVAIVAVLAFSSTVLEFGTVWLISLSFIQFNCFYRTGTKATEWRVDKTFVDINTCQRSSTIVNRGEIRTIKWIVLLNTIRVRHSLVDFIKFHTV